MADDSYVNDPYSFRGPCQIHEKPHNRTTPTPPLEETDEEQPSPPASDIQSVRCSPPLRPAHHPRGGTDALITRLRSMNMSMFPSANRPPPVQSISSRRASMVSIGCLSSHAFSDDGCSYADNSSMLMTPGCSPTKGQVLTPNPGMDRPLMLSSPDSMVGPIDPNPLHVGTTSAVPSPAVQPQIVPVFYPVPYLVPQSFSWPTPALGALPTTCCPVHGPALNMGCLPTDMSQCQNPPILAALPAFPDHTLTPVKQNGRSAAATSTAASAATSPPAVKGMKKYWQSFVDGSVCNHHTKWRRLRIKKGFNHMLCCHCGGKWKCPATADQPPILPKGSNVAAHTDSPDPENFPE